MPDPTTPSLLSLAREYTDRFGWSVIPVTGKSSACHWKRFQVARPSPNQLRGLFSQNGPTGLAVITGTVSGGLRVRDFDKADAYHSWAAAHPDLAAALPTSKTVNGFHVYFVSDIADGVLYFKDGELRAGKCFTLLPPSAHPDGGTYEWVVPPGAAIPLVADVDVAGLRGTVDESRRVIPEEVEKAIAKTLPTGYGQRVRQLWLFARRLKGIKNLDTSPASLLSYVREWHARALPFIKTKRFETTELAFYDAWTRAKAPLNDGQFVTWARQVLDGPDPAWLQAVFLPVAAKALLRVCAAMQAKAGDEPFYLAARTAGAVLGMDSTYANQLLNRLVSAGYLELVEKGSYGSKKASTWRYKGLRIESLVPAELAVAA